MTNGIILSFSRTRRSRLAIRQRPIAAAPHDKRTLDIPPPYASAQAELCLQLINASMVIPFAGG